MSKPLNYPETSGGGTLGMKTEDVLGRRRDTLDSLIDEWHTFCAARPYLLTPRVPSADEVDTDPLPEYDRRYITRFLQRWEAADEEESNRVHPFDHL